MIRSHGEYFDGVCVQSAWRDEIVEGNTDYLADDYHSPISAGRLNSGNMGVRCVAGVTNAWRPYGINVLVVALAVQAVVVGAVCAAAAVTDC